MKRASIVSALALFTAGTAGADDSVQYTSDNEVVRPQDYRQWVYLTSGLGMSYGPARPAMDHAPPFTNVFVNPPAYRAFMETGKWPDGTMFILEIRHAIENASINNGGQSQGDLMAIEASVKDSARYPDGGWAYLTFDSPEGLSDAAAPFPRTASCYSCHSTYGAVEWTFTQFYPEQFALAERLGTVRADYDPDREVESTQ
jgi:Cytochrome P460